MALLIVSSTVPNFRTLIELVEDVEKRGGVNVNCRSDHNC